jgi:hypothetical protein
MTAGAYTRMANDRRDFDPMGADWGYISDEFGSEAANWRGMVPVGLRAFTWLYQLYTDRHGQHAYGSVRLAPDWCHYAWGPEYVGAEWEPASPHTVKCRGQVQRRYAPAGEVSDWPANPFAGEGNDRWHVYEWVARSTLDLLSGTWELEVAPTGAERAPSVPADVRAEAEHKAGKLLAFFRAECEHWRAGDQERPVQAYDLRLAVKAESGED